MLRRPWELKRIRGCCATLLLALLGCNSPADKELEAGRRAFGQGRYREALRHYEEVVLQAAGSPQAAEALYDEAVIYYLKLRDIDSAQANLIGILSQYEDGELVRKARWMLAEIYETELGDRSKAAAEYRRLLDQVEDTGSRMRLLMSIGDCYYALDDLEQAADYYRRLVTELPYEKHCDPAFIRLAHIQVLEGQKKQALGTLERLLDHTDEPESRRRALLSAAEIYMLSQRYAEARMALARADREFPREETITELAQRLSRQEREGKSLDDGSVESQLILQELQRHISWGRAPRRGRLRR